MKLIPDRLRVPLSFLAIGVSALALADMVRIHAPVAAIGWGLMLVAAGQALRRSRP